MCMHACILMYLLHVNIYLYVYNEGDLIVVDEQLHACVCGEGKGRSMEHMWRGKERGQIPSSTAFGLEKVRALKRKRDFEIEK